MKGHQARIATGERGSVLLAVLLTAVALAWLTSVLTAATLESAREYSAHRGVVCARYAALSGLAVAEPSTVRASPRYRFGTGNEAGEAVVELHTPSPGRCVLTSEGRCGPARYPIERRVDADVWCR